MADYTTLDTLKGYLNIPLTDVADDDELSRAITTASSEIDHLCSRTFEPQVNPAQTRWFEPWFDRAAARWVLPIDDLFSTEDLAVHTWNTTTEDWTDPVSPVDGLYATTPWTQLILPTSTVYAPGGPYDSATAVQVTAKFGWPSVPAPVEQACLIQAARIVARRESRFGMVSTLDGSELARLTRAWDPDVANALRGFIKYWAVR